MLKVPNQQTVVKLLEVCYKYIEENNITCPETIYQMDKIRQRFS